MCEKAGDLSRKYKELCFCTPRYSRFSSKTAVLLNDTYNQTYGTGGVLGSQVQDYMHIGGAVVKDQYFGVAADSFDIPVGLLGLTKDDPHPNFVQDLAQNGLIRSNAFSLDLRSPNHTSMFPMPHTFFSSRD